MVCKSWKFLVKGEQHFSKKWYLRILFVLFIFFLASQLSLSIMLYVAVVLIIGIITFTLRYGIRKNGITLIPIAVLFIASIVVGTIFCANRFEYQRTCESLRNVDSGATNAGHVKHIFFLQTNNNPVITSRTACAIESAALHHPGWNVTLYVLSPVKANAASKLLSDIPKFRISLLDLPELYEGSALGDWFRSGVYKASRYSVVKLSDSTRYLLLLKFGGTYLDTDIVVLKSTSHLRNALGMETALSVNNAVMIFDKGHYFMKTVLERFVESYSDDSWGTEGPLLLSKLIHQICSGTPYHLPFLDFMYGHVMDPENCHGVSVLSSYAFYPVIEGRIHRSYSELKAALNCSYTLHLWNSLTSNFHSPVGSGQLLDVVAKENCPRVYERIVKKEKTGI